MIGRQKLVLASGSPRRLTLVNQIGIEPDALRPTDIDETPKRGELPRACATRLAREKAEAALAMVRIDDELKGAYILAADTIVAVGRRILPKAELLDEAAQCLRLLSGRNHRVHTAVCLVTPKETFRQRLCRNPRALQKAFGRGYRGLSRIRRMARQGGRLCGARHRRQLYREDRRLLFQRRRLPLYETATLLEGEGYPIHFGWLNTRPRLARYTERAPYCRHARRQTPRKTCPICGKPAAEVFRPFCSKRCADVDLHSLVRRRLCGSGDGRRRRGRAA